MLRMAKSSFASGHSRAGRGALLRDPGPCARAVATVFKKSPGMRSRASGVAHP
jgi:hypothetical protein